MKVVIATFAAAAAIAVCAGELRVSVLPGEGWWGGATTYGTKAPFGLNAKAHSFDIRKTNDANQAAPQMLSTKGRCVWSDKAFACVFTNGVMTFTGDAPTPLDQELFVRSAQVHALAPTVQFSAAPWRLLKGGYLDAVREAANTRMKHVDYILETAKACAKSGEPMLRAMEYEFPGLGAERITDQFMLGPRLLVAPQVVKGAKTRKVFVPTGTWLADDGTEVVGPRTVEIDTPISRLPHFVRR